MNGYIDQNSPDIDIFEKVKIDINFKLANDMVDVELSDGQKQAAINFALANYKTWSGYAREEAFLYLRLMPSESSYVLPEGVDIVQKIYRRGNGIVAGSASTLDPFAMAYTNTYLLTALKGNAGGGGLLTYELYHQFDNTIGKMFGREMMFTYNRFTRKLILERDVRGDEEVLLHVQQLKPDAVLLADYMSYNWIRDWSISECLLMLAKVRSKFSSIPGPQGGNSLDGNNLAQEGKEMQQKLIEDIRRYRDGSKPLGIIRG